MLHFLTIGGKQQYALSEHNFITDRMVEFNDPTSEKLRKFINDYYYLVPNDVSGKMYGSRVFGYLYNHLDSNVKKIEFRNAPGLKTDSPGSEGVDYLELSEQEDVALKYGLLAANGIILPTLADKTTYGSVHMGEGFGAFGIDWTQSVGQKGEGLTDIRKLLSHEGTV